MNDRVILSVEDLPQDELSSLRTLLNPVDVVRDRQHALLLLVTAARPCIRAPAARFRIPTEHE